MSDLRAITREVARRAWDEDLGTYAAGIALYAVITLPAIAVAVVALYGLFASTDDVTAHGAWFARSLPGDVTSFLRGITRHTAATSAGQLTVTAVASILFAVVSAEQALSSAASAFNRLIGLPERRRFWRRHAILLALAAGALVVAVAAQALLVLLPWLAARADGGGWVAVLVALRWTIAITALAGFLVVLYRFAPCAMCLRWRDAAIGAAVATPIALLASLGLSTWVEQVGSYQRLYGAAGSTLVILLWAYLTSTAALLGATVAGVVSRRAVPAPPAVSRWMA